MYDFIAEFREGENAARFFSDRVEFEGPGISLTLSPQQLQLILEASQAFTEFLKDRNVLAETGPATGSGESPQLPPAGETG